MVRWLKDWLGQHGYWAVSVVVAGLWSWLFFTNDAKLSSSQAEAWLTAAVILLIVVVISTGVYWSTIKFLSRRANDSDRPALTITRIFFVWCLAEFAVSWLIGLAAAGKGGSWDTRLPFSSLAPLVALTPLRFLGRAVGFYGLSAVLVTLIFIVFNPQLRRYWPHYSLTIAALTLLSWAIWFKPTGPNLTVTITSERLGQPQTIQPKQSQLVILPEYGLDQFDQQTLSQRIETRGIVDFIGTQQVPIAQGNTNVLIFGTTNQGFKRQVAKSRLIPFGEYLPYWGEIIVRLTNPNVYTNFLVERAVVKGSEELRPFRLSGGQLIGSAACSSIIATDDYRRLAGAGAGLLTNSASLDIFRGSSLFSLEDAGLLKFIAVANARPLAQSSDDWPAMVLNSTGQTVARINPAASAEVTVPTNHRQTLYTKAGDWPVGVGLIWLIISLVWDRRRHRHEGK